MYPLLCNVHLFMLAFYKIKIPSKHRSLHVIFKKYMHGWKDLSFHLQSYNGTHLFQSTELLVSFLRIYWFGVYKDPKTPLKAFKIMALNCSNPRMSYSYGLGLTYSYMMMCNCVRLFKFLFLASFWAPRHCQIWQEMWCSK